MQDLLISNRHKSQDVQVYRLYLPTPEMVDDGITRPIGPVRDAETIPAGAMWRWFRSRSPFGYEFRLVDVRAITIHNSGDATIRWSAYPSEAEVVTRTVNYIRPGHSATLEADDDTSYGVHVYLQRS